MDSIELEYDSQAFSVEAAQKAAYRLIQYFVLDLKIEGAKFFCTLTPIKNINKETFEIAIEEFKRNILDEQLRLKIKKETEPVRNLILGIAFSRANLSENE
jgi:His-Xaa-Ser system protein HxsD